MRKLLTIIVLVLGATLQSCEPAFAQTSNYGGVSINSFAANCIPLAVTAVTLQCGSLTDSGTLLTTTSPLLVPAGTITSPSLQWAETTANAGWYRNGANDYAFSIGNSIVLIRANNSNPAGIFIRADSGRGIGFANGNPTSTASDLFLLRRAAANLQLGGPDVNGVPVAQSISVQNAITGTDLPGSSLTIDSPKGTGAGAGTKTCLNRTLMGATGTTVQSATNGFCVGESKTLSNTSATATSLANISVPSNSSGGASGTINVSCNDGTNFDSETNTFFVSYVNKAGALTIGTAQLGTPSTANNSGSCTTAITVIAGTNSVDIKVTPVITTIVPTTTTGTVVSLSTYGTGNVTIN